MEEKPHTIPIASDHAGYLLKEAIIQNLKEEGYCFFRDFGTYSDESVDYPDFIHLVAHAVDTGEYERGIVLCGSGQGASMVANKYPNIRCALCWNIEQATLSRKHNDANMVSLPGRFIGVEEAVEIIRVFMEVPFEGGRHQRRIEKIPIKH
ncbi:MAG: ribose 5-phosphate isomerase B [Bacteroidales bacterium]|nr:ribose 5-phosphate isomerase B [Bacteroidales bacterium]